ncbi:MAG: S-layer protein domain-containing protein [Candidatus Magasanikbacteria bacterium]
MIFKNKIKLLFVVSIFVVSTFFIVSKTQAASVSCLFSWPQQVVVDGFSHVCGEIRNYCNNDKAIQGIAECCENAWPYSNCVKAGPATSFDVNTDFPIDAWGIWYAGWYKCEDQNGNRDQLSAFCKSKGYAKIWPTENVCYKSTNLERFSWNGAIPMVKGNSTGMGASLTKVKCSNSGYCTENWSCGLWSACSGGLQLRNCNTDANNCGTSLNKITSRSCCTESWICGAWSNCVNGQQVRTCAENNNCGTTYNKPAVAQACSCTPNWSCGAWSACSNNQQTRTCSDINNCGVTTGKPVTTQPCTGLSCSIVGPGLEALIYNSGSGPATQTVCNASFSHCRVSGNIGRCCPNTNSLDIDCMVDWPKRTILQGDGATDKKTLTIGETWNVRGGLVLKAASIDAKINPRQVWLVLYKNGVKINDKIAVQGQYYLYSTNYSSYPDFNLFGVYIDSIFAGATSDMVQLKYAYYNSLWESELSSCSENWSCGAWSSCFNRSQSRTCTDANSCGTTVTKPPTTQNCSCTESWSCGGWSSCINSLKTKTCTDANNCGTTTNKPVTSQSCCAENWSCGIWSSCFNGQQARTCTDLSNCQTMIGKPVVSQSCSCTESWSCGTWSACSNDRQTRTCLDLNTCGTNSSRPEIAQNCAPIIPTVSSTIPLVPFTEIISNIISPSSTIQSSPQTPIETTQNPPTPTISPVELNIAHPESNVFFGGVATNSYLSGETMKFYYKYQNTTENPIKIKIVRQLVNSKGKAVTSAQAFKTLKAGDAVSNNVKQTFTASLPAGIYAVKVKVYDAKNKIVDENSFPIELKKKYFILNEISDDTDIAWDAKIWSQVKTNVRLPVNLKLRFSYTNNTDAKHIVKIVRELIDENDDVKATKTSKWVMKVGEKDQTTFTQWLGENLATGNYTIRIQAYDWTSKELLAENSAGFTVEAR